MYFVDHKLVLQVPVAFWSVEATQPAWTEAHNELHDPDDSLEDLMESNDNMSACCGLTCVG